MQLAPSMAARQQATPPAWLARSRWALLADVLVGWALFRDRLVQLLGLVAGFLRPSLVGQRLARLRDLGHVDALPTTAQLLVAARDQMILSATEETRLFYASQGIPWTFHNLRRFLHGPATMLDPVGLFSPRDAIIEHVLQTFHRHPIYDLVLLEGFPGGVEEMERQAEQIRAGTHPHQRALASLIEDGAYHARLAEEVRAFRADPLQPARPIPAGLVDDPDLMLAMDQFKDLRGYARYASRLPVGPWDAARAWLEVGFNATVGPLLGRRLGPRRVRRECCDPDLVDRHRPHVLTSSSS
jgi:hypothetical protein